MVFHSTTGMRPHTAPHHPMAYRARYGLDIGSGPH